MAHTTELDGGARPLRLTWEQAHRAAAVAHLTGVGLAGDAHAPRPALLGAGPIASLAAEGHGAGAAARVADSLAHRLGRERAIVGVRPADGRPSDLAEDCRQIEAALLVVPTGWGGLGDTVWDALGTLSRGGRVCPLLAVPPGAARGYFSRELIPSARILCGVDRRDSSRRALAVARELAADLDAEPIALHVLPEGVAEGGSGDRDADALFPTPRIATGRSAAHVLRRSASSSAASLLVVGTGPAVRARPRGRGSVVSELVARAPVPVVVVPDPPLDS